MSTAEATFPGRGIQRDDTVKIKLLPGQPSDLNHDTPMTKAEREDLAELKELVHQQIALGTLNAKTQPQIQVQAGSAPTKWFLAGIAVLTLVGGAGNFIGSSGVWVGGKAQQQEYLILRVQTAENETAALRAKLDRLRDLYMIRFSEDPDKVDTDTMKRKKEK